MKIEIVYTDHFEKEFKYLSKKYRSIKDDLSELVEALEKNPSQGIS